jgi:predicted transcriptional regulator
MQHNALVHKMVGECMTPYLVTISRYKTIYEAYETMKLNKIRRLPVVDGDKLVGIVSYSDILEAKPVTAANDKTYWEMDHMSARIIVDFVMTKKPVVVYQADTVGHAAELMLEHKIGGLPVLDANHKLAGLITESDIFRLVAKQWREDNARL